MRLPRGKNCLGLLSAVSLLCPRYRDLQPRGFGASGVIWYASINRMGFHHETINKGTFSISCAHDSLSNLPVVLKKIANSFDSVAVMKRTFREVHMLNKLRHDNVQVPNRATVNRG